jgi:hypothetical protein
MCALLLHSPKGTDVSELPSGGVVEIDHRHTFTGTPHRARVIAVADRVGRLIERVNVHPFRLDPDTMRTAARKRVGAAVVPSGDEFFSEPLSVLARALDTEARLTFTGRYFARDTIVTLLGHRLQMEQSWREHPEILAEEIEHPIVIVGLPRSGTTLLQDLLATDPANRSLLHWEATNPWPPPEAATYESDPRIERSRKAFRAFDYIAPDAKLIHPLGPQLPTECVSLLNHSFASLEFAATYRVPSYVEWYLQAELTPHYFDLRSQLQLLQWHCRRERWVLKSPTHLFALPSLRAAFPGARIVQLHRDPLEAVASFASMVAILRGATSDHVDLAEVGSSWAALWAEGLDRFMAERDADPELEVLDLDYRSLLADPVGTVLALYAHFGIEASDAAVAAMHTHVSAHPQHEHGIHRYSLEQFSLDRDRLAEQFSKYRERLNECERVIQ